jgi:hypothetical protein
MWYVRRKSDVRVSPASHRAILRRSSPHVKTAFESQVEDGTVIAIYFNARTHLRMR